MTLQQQSKCCNIPNCVSESCCSYENCEGQCKIQKIELKDGCYDLKIPAFVFESDIEFAQSQGARVFADLWRNYNYKKKD